MLACASCHGARGEGSPAFPRLAGNGASCLLEQLNHFANRSREQATMYPIANGLSAGPRADVASFYAGLPHPQSPVAQRQAPAIPQDAGAWPVQRGRWSDGIPACAQCHGPDGPGMGEHFSSLTGLSTANRVEQISAWQAGKRPPGPRQRMSTVAQKPTLDDITAVAAHCAQLHSGAATAAQAPSFNSMTRAAPAASPRTPSTQDKP